MNISTLSQQLNMSTQELRDKMAQLGFKVSPRQRRIDNVIAKEVIQKLSGRAQDAPQTQTAELAVKKILVPPRVLVKDLAAKMKLPVVDVIKDLIKNGVMAAMNEEIDFDTASIVASDFGFEVELDTSSAQGAIGSGYVAEVIQKELAAEPNLFTQRPPIVAVMGHVDHGKTTLLDTLRKTNVAAQEAGAITQHIGAYQVEHNGKRITFLDTPGHQAFTQMRARGANVTDIIILVVAADDGVKPQTVEVINRARFAGVPLIVAINKIDKPDANPDRVKQQLAELGVLVEDWGGKTVAVPVSAKTGQGLDQLLDMTLLLAEVENLRANPRGQVVGTVIESHISRGQGPVATVIVQNGTLKVGDIIVAGQAYAKIRSLEESGGEKIKQATPSTPVRVFGLSQLPQAGDIFRVVETLDEARTQAREFEMHTRAKKFLNTGIFTRGKTLNLIIKADVQGSLEALTQSLEELKSKTEEVQLVIVDQGVGDINESDVLRAESSGATLIGFNVKATTPALNLAKTKGVNIDVYTVIYELLEDVTKALVSMLSPEVIRTVIGRAKILAIFRTEANNQVVGGKVEDGKVKENSQFVIKRDQQVIGEGQIKELQRNKEPVSEVPTGSEFGVRVETSVKIAEGDVLEFYVEEVKTKKLG